MIIESINEISTISEETTACAEEASSISVNNLEYANEAFKYVEELVRVSGEMKALTQ
ncbi:MAG: hypothetical protein J6F30_11850 [Cellulosilyticum sp.]|nr:hypothetical protein [Cellulosilyticum sp.]